MNHADPPEQHLLIFEPSIAGHRLTWLRYITEDFLDIGWKISWAVDLRIPAAGFIKERLNDLVPKVSILSAFDKTSGWRGGSKIRSLAECQKVTGAGQVFLPELDEIASNLLRCAALGILPPANLKGILNGIYFRPRFMSHPLSPIGNVIKAAGFQRLRKRKWFRNIYVVDEYLFSSLDEEKKEVLHFLPDPWSGDFSLAKEEARKALGIPQEKFVFLHFGIGGRRKGLHLATEAMSGLLSGTRAFLLCAGRINPEGKLRQQLDELSDKGYGKTLNRYVSDNEERLCFCAADAVIMPYIHHYGSSGVMSSAAAAGCMMIVSDEGLLARRVRDFRLGYVFPTENVSQLRMRMKEAMLLDSTEIARFRSNSLGFAQSFSRESFREALISKWAPRPGTAADLETF